jgi:glycine dehydrogenase subunit 1
VLCALAFSIHLALLGETGLRQLAERNHSQALAAMEALSGLSPAVRPLNRRLFNEFTLVLDREARPVVRALAERGILGGVSLGRLYPGAPELERGLVVAVTETTTQEDIQTFVTALGEALDVR